MDQTNINRDRRNKRKTAPEFNAMAYGKVPPQSRELEEAVLGAVMLERAAFDVVMNILKPECFYVESHQTVFRAIVQLDTDNKPSDLLTVVEELKTMEMLDAVGGPYFISKLTNAVVSAANIEAHARIVQEKFIQRELIRISTEIITDAYDDSTDVFDLLDSAEQKLFSIANDQLKKEFDTLGKSVMDTLNKIDEMRARNEEITGVPTGFPTLDKVTYGWQRSDLIILAARPSVGKTAFALNLARNAAMHPTKPTTVAFFSLEMSTSQLVQRILSAESEIHMEKISRGKMEDHEMQQLYKKGIEPLTKAKIFVDDSAALNIFELRAKCRRLKSLHDVGLIIIDYLQLMSGTGENRSSNREQEISNISRNLKALAKELGVPIIALSQLSRAVETRGAAKDGTKMPQLSDLRESGAIEQDADLVMFLYRPEYYEVTMDENGDSNRGDTFVKIAKHRNGALENIRLRALLHIQKFVDEQDGGGGYSSGFAPNWKPVNGIDDQGQAKVFLQTPSRMNEPGEEEPDF